MTNIQTAGARLKLLREQKGLSQTELGAQAGFGAKAASRISNYENNTRQISAEIASLLAPILDVESSVILYGHTLNMKTCQRLPLFSEAQAIAWPQPVPDAETEGRTYDSDIDTGEGAFFFVLTDEHISELDGEHVGKKGFMAGDIILIDPAVPSLIKDYVLMKVASSLRLMLVDGPERQGASGIIGTLVDHRRYKKKN